MTILIKLAAYSVIFIVVGSLIQSVIPETISQSSIDALVFVLSIISYTDFVLPAEKIITSIQTAFSFTIGAAFFYLIIWLIKKFE